MPKVFSVSYFMYPLMSQMSSMSRAMHPSCKMFLQCPVSYIPHGPHVNGVLNALSHVPPHAKGFLNGLCHVPPHAHHTKVIFNVLCYVPHHAKDIFNVLCHVPPHAPHTNDFFSVLCHVPPHVKDVFIVLCHVPLMPKVSSMPYVMYPLMPLMPKVSSVPCDNISTFRSASLLSGSTPSISLLETPWRVTRPKYTIFPIMALSFTRFSSIFRSPSMYIIFTFLVHGILRT